MAVFSLKPAAVALALFGTFPNSVTARSKNLDRLLTEPKPNGSKFVSHLPLPRTNIMTRDGREIVQQPVQVVTDTAPDGNTRHLATGTIECVLWELNIDFQGYDEDYWLCNFEDPSLFGGDPNKKIYTVEDGEELTTEAFHEFLELNAVTSGKTVIVLSEAAVFDDKMIINIDDILALKEKDNHTEPARQQNLRKQDRRQRRLTKKEGDIKTLVVRVRAENSDPPSAADLSSDIFYDQANLKTQYEACSYGKLTVDPYLQGMTGVNGDTVNVPNAAPGVIEITINESVDSNNNGNYKALEAAANTKLREVLGTSQPDDLFDAVIFCMPPGAGNWLAYAYVGRWDSYYNDNWCQSMSTLLHEVGHNLGLRHSGEYTGSSAEMEYGDQSGLMGFSYNLDDTPLMCFNPAKNVQLGWYSDSVIEISRTALTSEPQTFLLNGVADYGDMTNNANIVVQYVNLPKAFHSLGNQFLAICFLAHIGDTIRCI